MLSRLLVMKMFPLMIVVMMLVFLMTSVLVEALNRDFFHCKCSLMPEYVMDRCVWLSQQVRIRQVPLNSLDVVATLMVVRLFMLLMFVLLLIFLLVLTHVLLDCSRGCSCLLIVTKVCMLHLGVLHALNKAFNSALFLQNVETHLEDVVHLKLVTEALLLEVRIDVA